MQQLAEVDGVLKARAHQCAFGLVSTDKEGTAPAKKATTFLTNSVMIYQEMRRKCPGCPRHVILEGGRPRAAKGKNKECSKEGLHQQGVDRENGAPAPLCYQSRDDPG